MELISRFSKYIHQASIYLKIYIISRMLSRRRKLLPSVCIVNDSRYTTLDTTGSGKLSNFSLLFSIKFRSSTVSRQSERDITKNKKLFDNSIYMRSLPKLRPSHSPFIVVQAERRIQMEIRNKTLITI